MGSCQRIWCWYCEDDTKAQENVKIDTSYFNREGNERWVGASEPSSDAGAGSSDSSGDDACLDDGLLY